jgi:hypothetical protein
VAAGRQAGCSEQHERHDSQQAGGQQREYRDGPLNRVSPQLLVQVDRRDRLPARYGVEHRDTDHGEREERSERHRDRAEGFLERRRREPIDFGYGGRIWWGEPLVLIDDARSEDD